MANNNLKLNNKPSHGPANGYNQMAAIYYHKQFEPYKLHIVGPFILSLLLHICKSRKVYAQ